MSTQNLRLQVLLSAVDKLTRPLKAVTQGSSETARALKATQNQLKALNQASGQLTIFNNLKSSTKQLGTELAQARLKAQMMTREMSALDNPTQKQTKALEKQWRAVSQLERRQQQEIAQMGKLRAELYRMGISTQAGERATTRIKTETERYNAKLKEQERLLGRLNQQQKSMNTAKASYASAMDTRNKLAGFGATATATGAGMLYGGSRVMMPGVDFDVGMSRVQALTRTDKNSDELKQLRSQARELGASTSFTANDVAQGQGFLAMAGYTPDKIEKAMPHMLDLAKAAGMDTQLAEVADIASNIQGAYKIPAEQMQRVADALSFTFTTSNTDLRMLGETMKYLGSTAQSAGQDFETMLAMVGMLGNVGIQASTAGTAMRTAMLRMAKEPKVVKKALQALDISVADSTGQMKQMPELLAEIANAFKNQGIDKVGNAKKMAYISEIFGIEATSAIAELLDKQAALDPTARIETYAQQVKGALGTANQVAQTMADNMKGDLQGLQSVWQDLGIELFESVDSPLRVITQRITGVMRAFGQWMKENPQLTATLVKIGAAIGVFAVALGSASLALASILGPIAAVKLSLSVLGIKGGSALGVLTHAVKGVGQAVLWLGRVMLANPILLGVAMIAGAALIIWQNWDWFGSKFTALWNGIKNLYRQVLDDILAATRTVWRSITTFLSAVWDGLANIFLNWTLPGLIYQHWDSIKATTIEAWNNVMAFLEQIWHGMTTTVTNVLAGIKTTVSAALNAIIAFFTHWKLSTVFTTVWNNVINRFSNLPSRFVEIGSDIMAGLKQGIFAKWDAIKQGVLDLGNNISNWFKDKLGIHSPSRVFAEMGRYTVDGLAIGIEGNAQTALASMGQLSKQLIAASAGLTFSAAAVAMPPIKATLDHRAPLSPPSLTMPTTNNPSITIHIHAAPGMNEQQVAKQVVQELDRRERQAAVRIRSSLRDID